MGCSFSSAFFVLAEVGELYKGHIQTDKLCAVHLCDIYYNYLWLH